MLRENQDVFEIFVKNLISFAYESQQSTEITEAIVHFIFLDLASP